MVRKQEKVRLTITGIQRTDEGKTCVETTFLADCLRNKDGLFLFYEEQTEENAEAAKCLIKWTGGRLERIRRGTPDLHMVFEEGCLYKTDYPTSYGLFSLDIRTHRTEYKEEKNGLSLYAVYQLENDGIVLSECSLKISVGPC